MRPAKLEVAAERPPARLGHASRAAHSSHTDGACGRVRGGRPDSGPGGGWVWPAARAGPGMMGDCGPGWLA
jgi:hypothetical protein